MDIAIHNMGLYKGHRVHGYQQHTVQDYIKAIEHIRTTSYTYTISYYTTFKIQRYRDYYI